jgi:hypothetical protein
MMQDTKLDILVPEADLRSWTSSHDMLFVETMFQGESRIAIFGRLDVCFLVALEERLNR